MLSFVTGVVRDKAAYVYDCVSVLAEVRHVHTARGSGSGRGKWHG